MIDDLTRQQVRLRAKYLCEYCHSPERIASTRFTIDHVIPRSLGGLDNLENLALCCRRCNERRYNFVAGFDPETLTIVPLFNPRQQKWSEHFRWTEDSAEILGITPTGRATIVRLDLNDTRYDENDSIRNTRRFWREVGWHPPQDDV